MELGLRSTRVPFVVLIGGLIGAAVGFFMQYYSMAINYPFNVGGRPHNSWPVFIPITFELMILVGAFAAFLGMLFLNGLPHLHHPLFNVPQFARSSQDRFFLCIEAEDPQFDRLATAEFLAGLQPYGEVVEVPRVSSPGKEVRPLSTACDGGAFIVLVIVSAAGCQQKMADQPSLKPLTPCKFFADGRSERPMVAGTVARGHLQTNVAYFTGRRAGKDGRPRGLATPDVIQPNPGTPEAKKLEKNQYDDFVDAFPFPMTEAVLRHGYDRFMIYCVVCHDPLGTGHGKIVQRGYTAPPSSTSSGSARPPWATSSP